MLGNLVRVGLVELGRDDRRDAVALRGERLVLQAADRQDLAGQRHLAGHRDVVAHVAAGEQRDERRRHRDAGARAVLGDRAGRHVDVDVVVAKPVRRQARRELGEVPAHVGERRRRGLLHDVAELAGDLQLALAVEGLRLDEQHVAADRRPGQPGRDAGHARAALGLGVVALAAEQLARPRLADRALRRAALGDLARDLARDRADLALELAHAGLAGVVGDDRAQRGVGDPQLPALEAVALGLAGEQVALGDLQLLVGRVAGDLDRLHAIAQRPGDRVERVRRRDEHRRSTGRTAGRGSGRGSSRSARGRAPRASRSPGRRGSPSPSCRSRRS